jgi:aspartate-semialdehyde dehydrogenase
VVKNVMNKKYRVGIVGIGAVGTEMVKVLRQRQFPCEEIRIMARTAREEEVAGELFNVVETTPEAFDGLDFAFFAGTEGAKGASQQYGWQAVERGVIVIDNGDDFRMDPRVPLVVPEINPEALANHQGFIANPNCSTIIALMAVGPLHRAAGLRRMVAATYQAVSGTGRNAILELEQQLTDHAAGKPLSHAAYPHQILLNVLPQIGGLKAEMPGFTSEEAKMLFETRKILGDDRIKVCTTCVRVPVLNGHSEALFLEFEKPLSVADATRILGSAKGVQVVDDTAKAVYPMPLTVSGTDDCLVGRIRQDTSTENGLCLFVSGDNIRKGAALNAVQIAEALI